MSEQRNLIKVRATQNGVYAGYYRYGPRQDAHNNDIPADVFLVDATPYVVKDEFGNPVQETEPTGTVDAKGNKEYRLVWKKDKRGEILKDVNNQPIPVIRMASFFTPEWMEAVPSDTPITVEVDESREAELEPFRIPKQYRKKSINTAALPPNAMESAIERAERPVSPI